jgi:indole-3-glycerol phosphate synthase
MTITLDQLVEAARERCAHDRARISRHDLASMLADAGLVERPPGRFREALEHGGIRVIAEVKGASPLAGTLRAGYAPDRVAAAYADNGAAAISVLTEPRHFGGSLEALEQVSAAVDVPTLRKDFIVDPYQIDQAALAGAAAVLLIADVLEAGRLTALTWHAHTLGLDTLIEIHDARQLEKAIGCGSRLIGINNRNLQTMEVDWEHSLRVAPDLPAGYVTVTESGIQNDAQLRQLEAAGYSAALIGSSLMTAPDPGVALAELLGEASA